MLLCHSQIYEKWRIRTKRTHELYQVRMLVISSYACAPARSLKSELKHEPCHSIKLNLMPGILLDFFLLI